MVLYKKNGKVSSGYKLVKEDGTIVLNAPEEMWLAEGWIVFEPVPEEEPVELKFERIQSSILDECQNFYESVILKVNFNGELLWVPFADRVGYKSYLEDIQEAGITEYNYKGVTLSVEQALVILRQVNVYEFRCNQIYEQHVANIKAFTSIQDLENYDYTSGYPEGISL